MKSCLTKAIHLPLSLPKVASFFACTAVAVLTVACSDTTSGDVAGGPGSITTNGIVASAGGVAVPYARVSLRQVDYVAPAAAEGSALVADADVMTDSAGRFNLDVPEQGEFRLTVAHDGIAFSRIVSSESYAQLDSVQLEATATVTGVADVPDGNKMFWVGVMGTDVLVKSDSNGVFVIPALPANDSMQLYFMDENFSGELQRQPVYLAPYEQVLYNYKAAVVPEVKDSVEVPVVQDSVESPVDSTPKVTIMLPNGNPASYASVALRTANQVVEKFNVLNSMISADLHADEDGKFTMDWPDSGSYRLTVTSGSLSYSRQLSVRELTELDTISLSPSVKVTSNVALRSDEDYMWVGVYGLDVLVKAGLSGSYVLPALPANDSLGIYFVHKDSSVVFMDWSIETLDESASLNPSVMLNDFEGESDGWYLSVDTLKKGSTFYGTDGKPEKAPKVADRVYKTDRGSRTFNGYYNVSFDPYAWVLLGTRFSENLNMSGLDSIEFYARGNGKIRIALENWEDYSRSLKAASDWMELDSAWTRITVKSSELCWNDKEEKDCDNTWNEVKTQVKQLHLFPMGGNEFHVDDIKLYGTLFR